MRRIFDFIFALVSLIILSPALLFLTILIRLDSPGSIIYRSKRIGLRKRLFTLYKYRSMFENPVNQKLRITQKIDERKTKIGHLLRKYKLDELPQLFNILKGDMSLVGPRPEDPFYVNFYSPEQLKILEVKPGITSPASLCFHNEEQLFVDNDWEELYITKILPKKLNIDLKYFNDNNIFTDIGILLKTVLVIFHGRYSK